MIFRPSPPERDTMRNILETGFYTINHINENLYKQAHQTSARYDKDISEFDVTGLKPVYKNNFFAPFVSESHLQLGIDFKEKIDISINNTTIIIGEIVQIYLPENCLHEDGFIDLEKANTITCSGLDSYHKTIQLDRLSYAKPDKEITSLL
jgi:flavin reductase (DIM6/NTAB) family NADH-FMN oxidoreductase RutF